MKLKPLIFWYYKNNTTIPESQQHRATVKIATFLYYFGGLIIRVCYYNWDIALSVSILASEHYRYDYFETQVESFFWFVDCLIWIDNFRSKVSNFNSTGLDDIAISGSCSVLEWVE